MVGRCSALLMAGLSSNPTLSTPTGRDETGGGGRWGMVCGVRPPAVFTARVRGLRVFRVAQGFQDVGIFSVVLGFFSKGFEACLGSVAPASQRLPGCVMSSCV